jgi:hypothetical protein
MLELSPARNLDKLEALLQRIWSGELEHDQKQYYSCGTSACVCGWDYAIDMHDGNLIDAEESLATSSFSLEDGEEDVPWAYSRAKYNLTHAEAYLLFNSKSTLVLQKMTLSALNQGKRLELYYSPSYDVRGGEIGSDFYHNCPINGLGLPTGVLKFLSPKEPNP